MCFLVLRFDRVSLWLHSFIVRRRSRPRRVYSRATGSKSGQRRVWRQKFQKLRRRPRRSLSRRASACFRAANETHCGRCGVTFPTQSLRSPQSKTLPLARCYVLSVELFALAWLAPKARASLVTSFGGTVRAGIAGCVAPSQPCLGTS